MNESTARNIRVQDMYDELMRIGRHGHYETMFQVVREEIESLRQQLGAKDVEIARLKTVPMKYRRMAFNAQLQDENAKLSQQLDATQAKVDFAAVAAETKSISACKPDVKPVTYFADTSELHPKLAL